MFIDHINLNHLRIFECVFRTRSMTKAAEELFMTQSGVSQHIKLLEEMLTVKLFDRIKQRLVPTSDAIYLFEKCSKGLYLIEETLINMKGDGSHYRGQISIGLPIEFGNNIILPLLVEFGKKHKGISYKIEYGMANNMNSLLIDGVLDFAIVDDLVMDKIVTINKIYDEKLVLCCLEDYYNNITPNLTKETEGSKKYFESLDYIDFGKEAPLNQLWFKHNLGTNLNINLRSTMVDVQGMAKMITEGFGVGVLPDYLLKKLKKKGYKFHVFNDKKGSVKNTIGLALIEGKSRPPFVNALIEFIKESLYSMKKNNF